MLVVLDQLRLVPVGKWMERHLDILSIQAVLLKHYVHGRAPTTWQRLWQYKARSHVARGRARSGPAANRQRRAHAALMMEESRICGHLMMCHLQSPQVFMSQVG